MTGSRPYRQPGNDGPDRKLYGKRETNRNMAAVPEFHIGVFKAEGCYSRLYFCLHPKKDIFSSIQLMAIFEETLR